MKGGLLHRLLGSTALWFTGGLVQGTVGRAPLAPEAGLPIASPTLAGAYLRQHGGTLAVTALALLLGVYLAAQWQSRSDEAVVAPSRPTLTRETIDRLAAEQARLKKQIADLRAEVAARKPPVAGSTASQASFNHELATERALAGTVSLTGAGLELTLDDSSTRALQASDDPENYIVHEYQIRDVVNLLWLSGATGIAVNDERFVNSTSVYCVGSTILINDTRTSPPYHIVAVGDVSRMKAALDDGNALRDLKSRVRVYGLVFKVSREGTFTLPAFDGGITMKHTRLVEPSR